MAQVTKEEHEDLEAWGAPQDLIERLEDAPVEPEGPLVVMRRNWPALRLFHVSLTQWRHAGLSGMPSGLDYPGVEAAARMAAIDVTPDLFRRLRVMERAALVALEEQWD